MDLKSNDDLNWIHFTGSEKFDYPIDYWGAVLNISDDGHLDLIYRWAPNKYCHFHRHTAEISSTVLAGELHVFDYVDGKEVGQKIRRPFDFVRKDPGDVHMERGGPEGALVLFHLKSPDGKLSELLANDGTVIKAITIDDLLQANGL